MQFSDDDLVRVERVRIDREGRVEEIAECWISLSPGRDLLGIWLARRDGQPDISVPLADADIVWPRAPGDRG
jgi:hypothetical protein